MMAAWRRRARMCGCVRRALTWRRLARGTAAEMVTVQGIFDSAAVVDVPPLSPTALSLAVRAPAARCRR